MFKRKSEGYSPRLNFQRKNHEYDVVFIFGNRKLSNKTFISDFKGDGVTRKNLKTRDGETISSSAYLH